MELMDTENGEDIEATALCALNCCMRDSDNDGALIVIDVMPIFEEENVETTVDALYLDS